VLRSSDGGGNTRLQEISRPVAWSNILLAADLEATDNRSLSVALKLAQLFNARLVAAHVPSSGETGGNGGEFSEVSRRRVEERLAGIPYEVVTRPGEAWPLVSRLIEEKQANALVLELSGCAGASTGRVARRARGSPAEEIFHRAHCPVVTVGPQPAAGRSEARGATLERILYATDFSVESLAAAPCAVSLASRARAQLILLYANRSGLTDQEEAAMQTLRDLVPLGTRLTSKPRCLVERGALAEVSLRIAAAEKTDLLTLGVPRDETAAQPGPEQSIADAWRISCEATCPVLTIRS
jgi:nucleotide-binding universal stress UspA family protein